jgi:hypothetical protein
MPITGGDSPSLAREVSGLADCSQRLIVAPGMPSLHFSISLCLAAAQWHHQRRKQALYLRRPPYNWLSGRLTTRLAQMFVPPVLVMGAYPRASCWIMTERISYKCRRVMILIIGCQRSTRDALDLGPVQLD